MHVSLVHNNILNKTVHKELTDESNAVVNV